MPKKNIYLVCTDHLRDPEDTINGLYAEAKNNLPSQPTVILSGTGSDHLKTARLMGLKPSFYSSIYGGNEMINIHDQQKSIILEDGQIIPFEQMMLPNSGKLVRNAENNTVFIVNELFVFGLNKLVQDAKSDNAFIATELFKIAHLKTEALPMIIFEPGCIIKIQLSTNFECLDCYYLSDVEITTVYRPTPELISN